MSRSKKKVSIITRNAGSRKWWKSLGSRKLRRISKVLINNTKSFDDLMLPTIDEVLNPYNVDDYRGISYYVPDDLYCLRDNIKGWHIHRKTGEFYNIYPLDGTGHHDRCGCRLNKNSWYWKGKRK